MVANPQDPRSSTPQAKRALLLVNRKSRKGDQQITDVVDYLQASGLELIEASTNNADTLSDLICQHREQVDFVIVGGGDGTLNAAIEGLRETQLPLGILPLGTANDLARTLKIPTDLTAACDVILSQNSQPIDLGWVNGKYFFNAASLGLSVKITQQLSSDLKQKWGVLAYGVTALKTLWQTRPFQAEIHLHSGNYSETYFVKTLQIAVGNGRYYGGGMTIVEDATINDCRLDLYSLEIENWWEAIALFPALWQGKQAEISQIRVLQGQEINVMTRPSRWVNTDGELTVKTPARFRVIPQALSVFIPQASPS